MTIPCPAMIELSSDSDDDFDSPIGHKPQSKPQPQPQPQPHTKPIKRPAPPPHPPKAKKARTSTGGWTAAEMDRVLALYDAQVEAKGTADYDLIVDEFPGKTRKDLHAAVYRARKKKEGGVSVVGGAELVVVDESGTEMTSGLTTEAEDDKQPSTSLVAPPDTATKKRKSYQLVLRSAKFAIFRS